MKKTYIEPTCVVRNVMIHQMISTSNMSYDNASGTSGNITSGGNDSKERDIWGNEW